MCFKGRPENEVFTHTYDVRNLFLFIRLTSGRTEAKSDEGKSGEVAYIAYVA